MMKNKLIGTSKIELTNVNTGEVEVYENHNMITNALRDIFKPLGLSNSPARYFNDFATSQANGTIASICLTSKYGGFSSYGGKDVTVINVKQYEVPNTTDVNLNTEGYWRFFVTNGYLFLKACNSPFDLFKLQLSNPANVIKFKMIDGGNLYGTARFVLLLQLIIWILQLQRQRIKL